MPGENLVERVRQESVRSCLRMNSDHEDYMQSEEFKTCIKNMKYIVIHEEDFKSLNIEGMTYDSFRSAVEAIIHTQSLTPNPENENEFYADYDGVRCYLLAGKRKAYKTIPLRNFRM